MSRNNVFNNLPAGPVDEWFDTLARLGQFRVERIVSAGHRTPEGEWYDQEWDEWVMIVRGEAKLRMADPEEIHHLLPGDWISLPAHRRHRVEWTHPDQQTIWLAVHG